MTNLQMIEALCCLTEEYSRLVRRMAWKLEEMGAMDDACRSEIGAAMSKYTKVLGANELPDVVSTSSDEYHVAGPNIRIEEPGKEDTDEEVFE